MNKNIAKNRAMSKEMLVPESLTKSIIKEFDGLKNIEISYIKSYVSIGKKLIKAKEKAGFGNWENYVNLAFEARFGSSQATRYMKVAANPELAYEVIKNKDTVVNLQGINKAITNATEEEKAEAERIKQDAIESERKAKIQKGLDEIEKSKVDDREKQEAKTKPDAVIEEVEHVKSEVQSANSEEIEENSEISEYEPKPDLTENERLILELEECCDRLHETHSEIDLLTEKNEEMLRIFESDDLVKAAREEAEKHKEMTRVIDSRKNGLMSE